jgi:hypothetical protein
MTLVLEIGIDTGGRVNYPALKKAGLVDEKK